MSQRRAFESSDEEGERARSRPRLNHTPLEGVMSNASFPLEGLVSSASSIVNDDANTGDHMVSLKSRWSDNVRT